MAEEVDYYKILGVDKNATSEEIKKAYRILIRQNHPDLKKTPEEKQKAQKKVKLINKAYNTLSDPQKRAMYDSGGANQFQDFTDSQDFNFSDMFSNLFNFGQNIISDIHINFNLNIKDLMQENTVKISYSAKEDCKNCNGYGNLGNEQCKNCNGSGYTRMLGLKISCKFCSGTGKTGKRCNICNGAGVNKSQKTINLQIPKTVKPGISLRVDGAGHYIKGHKSSLIITLNITNYENFYIENEKLHYKLQTDLKNCLLRKQISLNVFGKILKFKLPDVLNNNTVLFFNDYGLWNTSKNRGTLYILLEFQIPKVSLDKITILEQLF